MKTATWLCPVLTLFCATRLVCNAQQATSVDYMESSMPQVDYTVEKRNKPSLSIVNSLDVLRQRLLLEIARRQMRENARQVELNRAILKNVGKRIPSTPDMERRYELLEPQTQPDYVSSTPIFDFLQRPALEALKNKKLSPNSAAEQQQNAIENETKLGNSATLKGNEVNNERNAVLDVQNALHHNSIRNDDDDAVAEVDIYRLPSIYHQRKNYYAN